METLWRTASGDVSTGIDEAPATLKPLRIRSSRAVPAPPFHEAEVGERAEDRQGPRPSGGAETAPEKRARDPQDDQDEGRPQQAGRDKAPGGHVFPPVVRPRASQDAKRNVTTAKARLTEREREREGRSEAGASEPG